MQDYYANLKAEKALEMEAKLGPHWKEREEAKKQAAKEEAKEARRAARAERAAAKEAAKEEVTPPPPSRQHPSPLARFAYTGAALAPCTSGDQRSLLC